MFDVTYVRLVNGSLVVKFRMSAARADFTTSVEEIISQ